MWRTVSRFDLPSARKTWTEWGQWEATKMLRRGQEHHDFLTLKREWLSYVMGASKVVPSNRKRDDGHKWKPKKFHFSIRIKHKPLWVWSNTGTACSLSWYTPSSEPTWTRHWAASSRWPCFEQGCCTRWPPEIPSNLNYLVLICVVWKQPTFPSRPEPVALLLFSVCVLPKLCCYLQMSLYVCRSNLLLIMYDEGRLLCILDYGRKKSSSLTLSLSFNSLIFN